MFLFFILERIINFPPRKVGGKTLNELKETEELHKLDTSCLSSDFLSYAWEIKVSEVFEKPKKYVHPMGARVWVKDIKLVEDQMKSKITYYV